MEKLTSLKNPKVMLWRSLKDRKSRRESGLFLVEGRRMTEEAIRSSFPVHALLLAEEAAPLENIPAGIPVYQLSSGVLAAVCDTRTPQGYAAVLESTSLPVSGDRLLILDDVQDPGNVGTMMRTADCAGFDSLVLSGGCADLFSPKVLRSTMGSIFRVPAAIAEDLPEYLRRLKQDGFSIIASELNGDPFYPNAPRDGKIALVIGNEGNGISQAVSACATHHLKLPMRGGAESLNAAVAAGIMMYDLMRNAG